MVPPPFKKEGVPDGRGSPGRRDVRFYLFRQVPPEASSGSGATAGTRGKPRPPSPPGAPGSPRFSAREERALECEQDTARPRGGAVAAAEEEEGAEATPIGERIPGHRAVGRRARASARTDRGTRAAPGRGRSGPQREAARGGGEPAPGRAGGSDHDRFVQQAAGLVQGPVLEGGDGAHAGRAAVLGQDHLRQRDRGTRARGAGPGRRPRVGPVSVRAAPRGAGVAAWQGRARSGAWRGRRGPGRLGPSTARGGPGWRATRAPAWAGMARPGAGRRHEETRPAPRDPRSGVSRS